MSQQEETGDLLGYLTAPISCWETIDQKAWILEALDLFNIMNCWLDPLTIQADVSGNLPPFAVIQPLVRCLDLNPNRL